MARSAGVIATPAGRVAAGLTRTVLFGTALAITLAGTPAAATSTGATAPRRVPATQRLVVLQHAQRVVSTLGPHPARQATLPAWAPITGIQTVLPVVADARTADGTRWLRVMLPGRPNGSTGWIAQRGTKPTTTSWRLVVRTASRRLRVYHRGRLMRSIAVVVGKPSTPTPHGRFFVEESILMPRGSAGAPYALALSARSNVLQDWAGGPGQIAIHGVANLGGRPGTAVSHGCIRLLDPDIRWLAARIAAGVPVTITS
jgi:lipoprotein-anchoring transpeptidase ErfK/SrfK